MRFLDPIALVYLLLAAWVLFVASTATSKLEGTQAVVAADASLGSGAPVTITAAPATDDDGSLVVEVVQGSGADAIATQLLARGVLAETGRFHTLLGFTGLGSQLRAGRYEFEPGTPAAEVIRKMQRGLTHEVVLVVPEGLRVEEVGELVVGLGVASIAEWETALALPRREPSLRSRPAGADLTGYLFPATYPLSEDTNAAGLLEAMVRAFEGAVSPAMRSQIEASDMTLHEVLTLASIIEREALLPKERRIIASVFLNRIEAGIALYADPTVQFAITAGAGVEAAGRLVEARTHPRGPRVRLALQHLHRRRAAAGPDREPGPRSHPRGAATGRHRLPVLRGSRRRLARVRRDPRGARGEHRALPPAVTEDDAR